MRGKAKKPDEELPPIDTGDYVTVQVKVHRIWQNDAGDIERVTVVMSNGNLETLHYDPETIAKLETAQIFRN